MSDELTQQLEWFRVTLASISDAVITVDIEARITFLNPAAAALTGWTLPDAYGQPLDKVFVVVHDETRERLENPIARSLREGGIAGAGDHKVLISRDGGEASITESASLIHDAKGNPLGVVIVFRDVTEGRSKARALRRSEESLNLALEAGQMGAWEWTVATGRVAWSPTLEAIHGLAPGTFGGGFEDFQRDMHPEDRERVLTSIRESIEGRRDYRVQYRIVKPDRSIAWIEARGRPILNAQGEVERMAGVCMDVTELRKLEAVHSRLAAVVEFSDDAIVAKTLDGIITNWNSGAKRMFGYEADEILGKPVTLLVPPERAGEESVILSRIARGEVVTTYETVRIRKDGTRLSVSLTVSPIKDASGAIIGASKIARDITLRKQADAEKAWLTSVLERSVNEIYIFSTSDLHFIYANQASLGNIGYTMEQMRRMTPVDLKPQFTDVAFRDLIRPLLQEHSEKLVFQTVHRRANGSFYEVEVHLQCVKNAEESVFLAVILDITQRRKVEDDRERLLYLEQAARANAEAAENRARFLAEASLTLASTLQFEDSVSHVAQAAVPAIADWCAVYLVDDQGTNRSIVLAHPDPDKVALAARLRDSHPDPAEFPPGITSVIRSGQAQFHAEWPEETLVALARDPRHLEVLRGLGLKSAMLVPLRTNRRVLGGMALVTGASGRTFTKADMAFAADLANRVATAAEHSRLYDELRQANAAKDRFMAVLSHELRTPLNPVLMTVADLEADPSLSHHVREQLTLVRRNVELEARLIDDLLDSTRIAYGKLILQRTVVDAIELIHRAVAIVEPEARAKGVSLEVTAGPEPCPVDGDAARLQQVVWNVVKNAVKFTPAGGRVRLTALCEPPGRLRVTVQDNGIGIAPSYLEKVFNAFEQGDPSTGNRYGGLGLGLAISKGLVSLHGGTLVAHSDGPGRGATFIIELPLSKHPLVPASFTPVPATPHRSLHLLVVEDHEFTAHAMVRLLTKRGYVVSAATRVSDALALLQRTQFDLLISDVGLPDGSGRELMEKVRELYGIPGIALSGYGTDADRAQNAVVGFSAHLTKPVDINLLDREIQGLFNRQREDSSSPNG